MGTTNIDDIALEGSGWSLIRPGEAGYYGGGWTTLLHSTGVRVAVSRHGLAQPANLPWSAIRIGEDPGALTSVYDVNPVAAAEAARIHQPSLDMCAGRRDDWGR